MAGGKPRRKRERWQPSFDRLRLELREERRQLEALEPKWAPPPFGRLISMFYLAADTEDPALRSRRMAEYRDACEAQKAARRAEEAAWNLHCSDYQTAERAARARGEELDEAAWAARWEAERAGLGVWPTSEAA